MVSPRSGRPEEPRRQQGDLARLRYKKAVHFGAGRVGRGLIATLLHKNEYNVVFVEKSAELIRRLKRTPEYMVTEYEVGNDVGNSVLVQDYTAAYFPNERSEIEAHIKEADIVTCRIGLPGLTEIAPYIANGIAARTRTDQPLVVIACEDEHFATDRLRGQIERYGKFPPERVSYGNSVLDGFVLSRRTGSLDLEVEKDRQWIVDRSRFQAGQTILNFQHTTFVFDLNYWYKRVFYTVKTAVVVTAYFGHFRRIPTIREAVAQPDISKAVRKALAETTHFLVNSEKVLATSEKSALIKNTMSRLSNRVCDIPCKRIGKDPLKMLLRDGPLVAPAKWLARKKYDHEGLLLGIEMALRFQNVEDDKMSQKLGTMMKSKSAKYVTEQATHLNRADTFYSTVLNLVKRIQGPCPAGKRHARMMCSCLPRSRGGTSGPSRTSSSTGSGRRQELTVHGPNTASPSNAPPPVRLSEATSSATRSGSHQRTRVLASRSSLASPRNTVRSEPASRVGHMSDQRQPIGLRSDQVPSGEYRRSQSPGSTRRFPDDIDRALSEAEKSWTDSGTVEYRLEFDDRVTRTVMGSRA